LAFFFSLLAQPALPWQFTASQAQNVDLLGHVGGSCRAVAAGQQVLIGQGPRLTKVDVTSPSRPVERASLLLPAKVQAIAFSGNLACVLAGDLWVVDTSGSGSLREVARVPFSGESLFTTGTIVYVLGQSPNIQVVDIRYPASPLRIGVLDLPHSIADRVEATGFSIKGHYAFVSYVRRYLNQGNLVVGGFVVLDISDPKPPGVLGDIRLNFPAYGSALDGNSLYLLMDKQVMLMDVTDPLNPRQVGFVAGPGFAHDISIANGRAYVAGPSVIWEYALNGINLPRELLHTSTRGEAVGTVARGNRLFVADGWTGFRVFDVATTRSIAEIGGLDSLSAASDVAVAGRYAYVADSLSGVRVFDLANPDHPVEVGRFPTIGQALGVRLNGSQAYVAEDVAGLEILDVRQPTKPVRLSTLATTDSVRGVAFLGDYALVANGLAGLLLVRIADPRYPYIYGRCNAPGYAEAVAASVNRAFVADRSGLANLWEIDVSSPAFPIVRGLIAGAGEADDVALDGARVCVAQAEQGLQVVDISWPGHPRTAAQLATSGSFRGVVFQGNLAYVADAAFGLRVVSVLDSYNPSEAGFLATPGFPRRLAVANNRIYLAAGEAGLYVLRFRWAPDLTIRNFDFQPQDVKAGTELHLTGQVLNDSTTPTATAFSIGVYVSPYRDFSEPRQLLCPPLRIEAGLTHLTPIDLAARRFVVLSGIPSSVYRVGIIVDADNQVAEFREDNNMASLDKPLYMGPRPSGARSWALYR
jgi:hypothetical protein